MYITAIVFDHAKAAIWNCNNRYEHKNPESSEGAVWCADEGGSCSGPGRVYYGAHLTWTYVDYLDDGQSIDCSNDDFGCDPLWGTRKKCYIERYRCHGDNCQYKQTGLLQYDTLYVAIDFSRISILKTIAGDGSEGSNEEWYIPDGEQTITMNVNHLQYGAMDGMTTDWDLDDNGGCTVDLNNIGSGSHYNQQLITETGGLCQPQINTESTDTYGFQTCFFPSNPTTVVTQDVFESGLKYTFNFQIGDWDETDGFDNGPIYDFTYTEPDHRDLFAIIDNGGYIERYFTRTGPNGRKARLFLTYWVVPDYDDLPVYFCQD